MAGARGLCNHALYMARVLLDRWRESGASGVPQTVLDAAYGPSVRLHLLDAYGWFLLATLKLDRLPDRPPHRVSELPALEDGIACPPEIGEFRQLEDQGWLAPLLAPVPLGLPAQQAEQASLAVEVSTVDRGRYEQWYRDCQALFARMDDGLQEQ